MKLSNKPVKGSGGNLNSTLPVGIKQFLSTWPNAIYREYSFGYTLSQEYSTKRFKIHRCRVHVIKPEKLYIYIEKPIITLQFTLEGNIPCILKGTNRLLLSELTFRILYIPSGKIAIVFEPGDYESLHIEMGQDYIEDFAQINIEARELSNRYKRSSKIGAAMPTVSINYLVKSILINILKCQRTRKDFVIAMHRYIINLLAEYISGIEDERNDETNVNLQYKEMLLKMKEDIISAPHIHIHSLKRLSKKYGINMMTLKRQFKAFFGMSPGSFILYHVLNYAYNRIVTSDDDLNDISEELGYKNRSSFDKIFKNQFGLTPARLKKGLEVVI